jgi:hypothetical protein
MGESKVLIRLGPIAPRHLKLETCNLKLLLPHRPVAAAASSSKAAPATNGTADFACHRPGLPATMISVSWVMPLFRNGFISPGMRHYLFLSDPEAQKSLPAQPGKRANFLRFQIAQTIAFTEF